MWVGQGVRLLLRGKGRAWVYKTWSGVLWVGGSQPGTGMKGRAIQPKPCRCREARTRTAPLGNCATWHGEGGGDEREDCRGGRGRGRQARGSLCANLSGRSLLGGTKCKEVRNTGKSRDQSRSFECLILTDLLTQWCRVCNRARPTG